MSLIYKCSQCGKIIDDLDVERVNEKMLGFDILTPEEREDIIEARGDNTYVNVICDDCLYRLEGEGKGNFQIH